MGSNVFGTPITTETLKGMPEFCGKTITIEDRAKVAMQMKNAEGKDVNARQFAEGLWGDYRKTSGNGNATMCLLYNATGGPVILNSYRDWSGRVTLSPYPMIIQNGQWGVYLHARFATPSSNHAISYNGFVNNKGESAVYALGFIQRTADANNRCVAEIFQYSWDNFNPEQRGVVGVSIHDYQGTARVTASIGDGQSPAFEAIMTVTA